jgi:hypothetical protein
MVAPDADLIAHIIRSLPPLELLRVAPMPEVERLSGMSEDTWERRYPDKVVKLSPRRKGVRVVHALMLSRDKTAG